MIKDRSGEKVGRLTLMERVHISGSKRTYYKCKCDCGNPEMLIIRSDSLKETHTTSCGCVQKERASEAAKKSATNRVSYGESKERLHNIWYLMRYRCENSESPAFHRYGGRGITVCDEWKNYFSFKEWAIHNGYDKTLTLDRIDNNLGYCPENCRWATPKIQNSNKSSNRFFVINGEKKTLTQWCEYFGIDMKAVHARLKRGWGVELALTVPLRNSRKGIA